MLFATQIGFFSLCENGETPRAWISGGGCLCFFSLRYFLDTTLHHQDTFGDGGRRKGGNRGREVGSDSWAGEVIKLRKYWSGFYKCSDSRTVAWLSASIGSAGGGRGVPPLFRVEIFPSFFDRNESAASFSTTRTRQWFIDNVFGTESQNGRFPIDPTPFLSSPTSM